MQIFDNELTKVILELMENQNIDFQLVPAHIHQKNSAEQAVGTWKNHLLAVLSSVDDVLPMNFWD